MNQLQDPLERFHSDTGLFYKKNAPKHELFTSEVVKV